MVPLKVLTFADPQSGIQITVPLDTDAATKLAKGLLSGAGPQIEIPNGIPDSILRGGPPHNN